MTLQPPTQESFHGPTIREEIDEVEAAAERRVEDRDRTVRRIHRGDDEEVLRELERLGPVLQVDLIVVAAVLE